MRALEGGEEPGNVSAGERRKGHEGLGGEARGVGRRGSEGTRTRGTAKEGQIWPEGLGSESSGWGKEGSSGEESPGKDHPRRRASRYGPGEVEGEDPWSEARPRAGEMRDFGEEGRGSSFGRWIPCQ